MRPRVRPKKRLSQNFMTSASDLAAVADALNIEPGEEVLEIGPGAGALTRELLGRGARVFAVERDASLTASLKENFKDAPLRVVSKDILRLTSEQEPALRGPLKAAGNIPYHITSPIIEWLIAQRAGVSLAVLTVQWEVARRLSAKPGGKDWGSLSVFLQFYADVEFLRKIDKSHFYPAPKVDSGVIRLRFLKTPRFALSDEERFFSLVRRAFQKRRKTLLNALADENSAILSKKSLSETLSRLPIDARRRPETLSLQEWADLSEALGSPS